MHPDVQGAFDGTLEGLNNTPITGAGSHLIILDNFSSGSITGNLTGTTESKTHGQWTSQQARLVAPGATYDDVNQPSTRGRDRSGVISNYFSGSGLQVVNMSFALVDPPGTSLGGNYSLGTTIWDSLVEEAYDPESQAVLVKAAGNGGPDTTVTSNFEICSLFGCTEYQPSLNILLLQSDHVLYVGALEKNGTVDEKASLAAYSTEAGTDAADKYLVVGVEAGDYAKYEAGGGCDTTLGTCLFGTSFAAPIVSGYAAMLGEKFAGASPAEITSQLLDTARRDTILNHDFSIHGQGEACLSCALAPATIPQ